MDMMNRKKYMYIYTYWIQYICDIHGLFIFDRFYFLYSLCAQIPFGCLNHGTVVPFRHNMETSNRSPTPQFSAFEMLVSP